MILQINFKSGKPVYLQVVDQIKAAAASGALQPGEALPYIRPLAEELRVNRNTIAKAYSELESLGVIETLPGKAGGGGTVAGLRLARIEFGGFHKASVVIAFDLADEFADGFVAGDVVARPPTSGARRQS